MVATASLAIIFVTMWKVGECNDLAMRASMPAQFVIWIIVLRRLFGSSWEVRRPIAPLLTFALIVALIQPLWLLHDQVTMQKRDLPFNAVPTKEPPRSSITALPEKFHHQYLGRTQSFFFRRLARKPSGSGITDPLVGRPRRQIAGAGR